MSSFPHYKQPDAMDCGPTCLRIVAKHFGRHYNLETLRQLTWKTREGVSLLTISDAAEKIGFRTQGARLSWERLEDIPLPAIIHWNQYHFVVLYKIKKRRGNLEFHVSDPAHGLVVYNKDEFLKSWATTQQDGIPAGIALLLEPTAEFYKEEGETVNKTGFRYLFSYFKPYRKLTIQLMLGFFTGSILSLLFPFLTQAIVDVGISMLNCVRLMPPISILPSLGG